MINQASLTVLLMAVHIAVVVAKTDLKLIWFYKQRACQDADVDSKDGWDMYKTGRTIDVAGIQALWSNPKIDDTEDHCLELYPDDDSGVVWYMPYSRMTGLCYDLPILLGGVIWKNIGLKDGACDLASGRVLPSPQTHPHYEGYVYKQFSNYDPRVPLDVTGEPDASRTALPDPTSSDTSDAEDTTAISTSVSTVYQPPQTYPAPNPNPNPNAYPNAYSPIQNQQYPSQPNYAAPNAYNTAQPGPTSATQADASQSTASDSGDSDASGNQRRRSWKSRL